MQVTSLNIMFALAKLNVAIETAETAKRRRTYSEESSKTSKIQH